MPFFVPVVGSQDMGVVLANDNIDRQIAKTIPNLGWRLGTVAFPKEICFEYIQQMQQKRSEEPYGQFLTILEFGENKR